MKHSELSVRVMQRSDLPSVVAIHRDAFNGYKSTLLGPRFVSRLYEWSLVHDEAIRLIAEQGPGICGFAVGARLGSGPAITRFTCRAAAQAFLSRPWLLAHPAIRAGFRLKLRQMRHPSPALSTLPGGEALPTAALVGIGVAPGRQGGGIGTSLLAAFESDAERRGYRRGYLGVRRENAPALRLYERCGWAEWLPGRTAEALIYVKILAEQRASDPGEHPVRPDTCLLESAP